MQTITRTGRINENLKGFPVIPLFTFLAVIGLWVAIAISFPGLDKFPIIHDIPIFHYIAQRILLGDVPYRDILDINFPGVYFLHMFVLTIFGKSDIAWASFTFLWLGMTVIAAGWYCWRISRLSALLVSAQMISLTLLLGSISFGQRDFFMMLFLLLSLNLFANELDGGDRQIQVTSIKNLLGTGFFLGAASMIKPTPMVLLAIFFVMLLVPRKNQVEPDVRDGAGVSSQHKKRWYKIFWLFAGAVTVPALIFVWLAIRGGLNSFIDLMVQYNMAVYSGLYRLGFSDLIRNMLFRSLPFLISFPILLIGIMMVRDKKHSMRIWLAVLAVAFGAFHYLYQGKGWAYHNIPFLMFCLLFQALIVGKLLRGNLFVQVLALTSVLLMNLMIGNLVMNSTYSENLLQQSKPAVPLLVDDLRMLGLVQQDQVQVMDAVEGGMQVLYLLEHQQSTRYIYDSLFIRNTNHPFVKDLQSSFIDDLQKKKPRFIVIFIKGPFPEETGIQRYQNFPQFLNLLSETYQPTLRREYYIIYEYVR